MNTRGMGILLHITSLPGKYGIGDLGPEAHDFVAFLSQAGQRYWQILPMHPTDLMYDNSPYHSLSAFANNPLFISPEFMVRDGYLLESDLEPLPDFPFDYVDYPSVITYKESLFSRAFINFKKKPVPSEYLDFCRKQSWWLDDYALFIALRKKMAPLLWGDWPESLKERKPDTLEKVRIEESVEIEREKFLQYIFSIQWAELLEECKRRAITLIGDIPIYVDYDSADLWINPEFYKLDKEKKPEVIAGVPPDYFSKTGQVWNNPIYDWEELKRNEFSWWIKRIERLITSVDYIRIDHFRGLIGYWEIPAGSETAIQGEWKPAPAEPLLKSIEKRFPYLPIIAEDLGIITPDVREIMKDHKISGMKVLLFAFGSGMPDNPYIPHNIPRECIVYTGTHDNNPILGWFTHDATEEEKENLFSYLGREIGPDEINDVLIRMALMSVGNTVIIPVQDILGLGAESRMNQPGINEGNWKWRLGPVGLPTGLSDRLRLLGEIYGRL